MAFFPMSVRNIISFSILRYILFFCYYILVIICEAKNRKMLNKRLHLKLPGTVRSLIPAFSLEANHSGLVSGLAIMRYMKLTYSATVQVQSI